MDWHCASGENSNDDGSVFVLHVGARISQPCSALHSFRLSVLFEVLRKVNEENLLAVERCPRLAIVADGKY